MRFSLKWILAGTVYVAIAAAAFSFAEKTWIYCDVLWGLTLLMLAYSGVVVLCASGRQRATAAGFVFASLCILFVLAFGDGKGTAYMVLDAIGIRPGVRRYQAAGFPMPQVKALSVSTFNRYLRAGNAVATLAFGLLGSLVGLMAFRASVNADGPGRHTN